jgi:hypothetical protein
MRTPISRVRSAPTQHDVHDADSADEERDPGDRPEKKGHRLGLFLGLLEHLGLRPDHEVVFLAGRLVQLVPLAQQGADLFLRLGDLFRGRNGGHDHPDRRGSHDLLADRLVGGDTVSSWSWPIEPFARGRPRRERGCS